MTNCANAAPLHAWRQAAALISAFVIGLAASCGIAAAQSDLVKRGDYLVNGILTCGNCHSPKGPAAEVAEKAFSGGLSWDEPPFKVTAPNITQEKDTGIGKYTDAELKEVLRKGIKRNGVPVAMIMPSGFYEIMTERDLDAVVAYLHTIKPVSNTVPDPVYKMTQGHPIPPGGDKAFTEASGKASISPPLRIAWNAIRRLGRADGISRTGSALEVSSYPVRGACRYRAISRQARRRVSAPGPTTRSSAPSPKASAVTAAS
jgi:mono/diheme cytochrome c family protein